MVERGLRRTVAATVATFAVATALCVTGAGAASAADAPSFAGSVPTWATAANDAGTPAADETEEGEVYLPLRDQKGAEQLAKLISTPGVANFRHGVTPAQWIARFSPTQADFTAVIAHLKSKGLTIKATPQSRQWVTFRGTPDQLANAFGTQVHLYNHAGTQLLAPSSAPVLPASIASKVSAISLDQSRTLTRPHSIKQGDSAATPAASSSVQRKTAAVPTVPLDCSHYTGEHTATLPAAYGTTTFDTFNCGYTPAQLRSAYGVQNLVSRGNNGAGQTVAIIDAYASPTIVKDTNAYSAALGEPGLTAATYSQIVPAPSEFTDQELCQGPSGWQGEQTLDVQAVHGIAPGAKILYVGGYNCGGGLDQAMSKILDGKLANIVSNSYGNVGEDVPADVVAGENNLYIQAAGEGIGLYFSSGDNGDEVAALGDAEPDFAASSPWVTAVGGTSLGIDKSGRIAYETGWGDQLDKVKKDATTGALSYTDPVPGSIFGGGAGGGRSTLFAQPDYQRGVVPNSLAQGKRVSPDIAALADPYTGYLIGITPINDDLSEAAPFENETYGGTSLASPLVAAQIALVQQATRSTIGFANPTLYAIDRVLPFAFRDVVPPATPKALAYTGAVSGSTYLITLDRDTSLTTARRYDDVTGIGGVSFTLLNLLAQGRH